MSGFLVSLCRSTRSRPRRARAIGRACRSIGVALATLATAAALVADEPPGPLAAVDDFTYQLQGKKGAPLDLAPIRDSAFDLCIIDFSRDGLDPFSPAEIAALRSAAEPDRVRLAYLSIGEAEDYRFYWDALDPALLAGANPEWKGNHKVRYWEPAWRDVLLNGDPAYGAGYLDRVIDQGFDGVYLDIVDAFEFFGPKEEGGEDVRRDAAAEMIRLIEDIAHHARVVRSRPDFLVVPQNGANIIDPAWYPVDTLGPGDPPTPTEKASAAAATLFATVDAIGVEEVFFRGKKKNDNKLKPASATLAYLAEWQAAALPVFSVEYVTKSKKVSLLHDVLAPSHGFVPYATKRSLAKMIVAAGHEPD